MSVSFEYHLIIFLIFVSIDILIYRFFKKNIIFSLKFFIIIFIIFINIFEINLLLINILFFYFLFSIFYTLTFTGIKNTSPSLFMIHHLANNDMSKKIQINENFLNQQFTKKRLKENFQKNFLIKKKKNIIISKKGKLFMYIFSTLKKTYNL
ncbi:unknown membrane protein [Candidatus Pelagibacter ubique HTCC1002]|uniref:Uncharacterized protein n=3 Tax=Pelagibacter ubique TaxID=198252 RepID=Q4FN75_PELUB|nr:hypothetical protein [Candidatus Pelagibacter ubique]AAZ21364.1 unknown membrane protein [Candidatus Pelagibacter ubique HTCC1062]EAS84774.1 unknown membrane protein [Candidatus Pelagibacter ubique HTCC1002]